MIRPNGPTALLKRYTYMAQTVVTAVNATVFVLTVDAVGYRGMLNAAGILFPPIVIGILMNHTWDRRIFMIMALLGVSLLTSIFIGVNFTSYD